MFHLQHIPQNVLLFARHAIGRRETHLRLLSYTTNETDVML